MTLRIGVYVLAALLVAAHFLRQGNLALVVLCLMTPLLFLLRKRWVLVVLQILAYGSAALWTILALRLVQSRQLSGRPWLLAAAILGAVALITVIAGLLLNSRPVRQRYRD